MYFEAIGGILGFHPLFSLMMPIGFLGTALGIAQLAAPFLGKIFGGGPSVSDLPPNLQGASQLTIDALRQSQELRGGQIDLAQQIQERDSANARSIGFFDPTSLGPEFSFLQAQQDQFKDVDLSAKSIKDLFDRKLQITQLAQQIGSQSPNLELGIAQLLGQAAQASGGGMGGAVGGLIGMLGSGLAQNKAAGGGGGILDVLNQIGGGGIPDLPGGLIQGASGGAQAPPPSSGGTGQAFLPPDAFGGQGGGFSNDTLSALMQDPTFSALIQNIINQASGE
jgi:hypothetical protein